MTKPRPFQREGVLQIYRWDGRALLADEMGLGKTIQCLYWIKCTPRHRPVLIVCPNSVKYNWQVEAHGFGLEAHVIEGTCPKRFRGKLQGDIIIINYDILRSWLGVLARRPPVTLVLDECHYLKNVDAMRTKAAHYLSVAASSVIGTSGTPMTSKPIELWPVLAMIRPDLFPNRTKFAWRYCDPRKTRWGYKFDGARRKKELHRILRAHVMIRRLKKDVAKDLPDKTHKMVPFLAKSYAEYNRANTDLLKWLQEISPSRALRAKKAQSLAKVGYLLRICADMKKRYVLEWIHEWSETHPGKKLVGLTMHSKVIEYLKESFPGESVTIDGTVTGKKRHNAVFAFQNDPRIRYMWGNWRAAGVGITAHAAHNFVAIDLPWTAGNLEQGLDRVHRIGQKEKVIIYYLLMLNTIEERLMQALQKKSGILRAILDGKRAAKDFDVLELLLKEIQNG
jgi:SWI/SNF-related matrix-associated actin-dependent regulator 1 of chromatin subfamily A